MTSARHRLVWLSPRHTEALLLSALCGDEIMAPGRGACWLSPAGVSRGGAVMLLSYGGEDDGLGFCVAAPPQLSVAWVNHLRADLSAAGAERRWGQFVGLLGRHEPAAAIASPSVWQEATRVHAGAIWRVRRARHGSALIDRLAQRDRMEGEQKLRAALGLARPADANTATWRGAMH